MTVLCSCVCPGNSIIQQIEERMDDFDKPTPAILNASGLLGIGRSTVLTNAIQKCDIVDDSYMPPSIFLSNSDSIEDLIVKLYDQGYSEELDVNNLMSRSNSEKIDLCVSLLSDFTRNKEYLLIRDDGCLVDHTGSVRSWFDDIARRLQKNNELQLLLVTSRRINPSFERANDYVWSANVPELTVAERRGLLSRVLSLYQLELSVDEISKFSDLLTGFPDQVFYACHQIQDLGVTAAWKKSHDITAFNAERASIIISDYSNEPEVLKFIYLLARFEFISVDFLFQIEDRPEVEAWLSELIVKSICDYTGADRDFVRLNDSIRDHILRNKIEIDSRYEEKLSNHLKLFLEDPTAYEDDISDVLYSIKESIKAGKIPPERYLVPSHFLKSIRELYQARNYNRVIELANRILEKENSLDDAIARDIRYNLCLCTRQFRNPRLKSHSHSLIQ